MQISKSDYLKFLKHPAWLWLIKYSKKKLPPDDPKLQVIFDEGHEFEKYAERLFPNAVRLGFSEDDFSTYLDLPHRTSKAIQDGAETIFQGRFEYENLTCIVDVLDKSGEEYDLIEIKSGSSVKKEYIDDLSFQLTVLRGAGVKVRKVFVVHVNKNYVRKGDINVQDLCVKVDVTDDVKDNMAKTQVNIKSMFEVLRMDEMPDLSPRHANNLNEWMNIYKFIHEDLDEYSIYNLCRLSPTLIGELEDIDVKLIKDIPSNSKLAVQQRAQIEATKNDHQIIDKDRIKEFLEKIKYPLYFLDYETMASVIPYFDGTKPNQQLPFQYSLHIIRKSGKEVEHKEYLHQEKTMPVLPLLKKLKEDIGNEGTVLVWHDLFEKGRNKEMGEMYPEYEEFMRSVNDRIIDLKIPFSKNWFVDKKFFGSASIKAVMPALVTDLSYKELLVQEGKAAQKSWMETVLDEKNEEKRDEIMNELLKYCRLDTLAMVRLFEILQNEVNKKINKINDRY